MYQLKHRLNLIDHNTISFDLRSEEGHTSYIKFGGFDTFGLKNNVSSSMELLQTVKTDTWELTLNNLTTTGMKSVFDPTNAIKYVLIDPSVRYIYVPGRKLTKEAFLNPIIDHLDLKGDLAKGDC